MGEFMQEECRNRIYSEDYLDYLIEYHPNGMMSGESRQDNCFIKASNRFAVIYEEGKAYGAGSLTGVKMIPRCYGLVSSEEILESAGIAQVRRQASLNLMGQGILVGFVDTGIDYSHPAFIGSDGRTRILSIWDQTVQNPGEEEHTPEFFDYGAEYTMEDINRALESDNPLEIVPSRDEEGHGTFLAGAACGNDMPESNFSGVAPLASICMVKCKEAKQNLRNYYFINSGNPCYAENDIMLAVRYLSLQATKYNMPLVICIGLGTNQGGHSSGGILGEMLQNYGAYRGTVVVTAVGNEANSSHHFQSNAVNKGESLEVEINVGENEYGFMLELWTDATELYSVGLISPDGEYSGKTPARLGEQRRVSFLFAGTVVYIEYLLLSFENGDECIRIRFENPTSGIWKVRVFNELGNSRRFDMWLPMRNFIGEQTYFLRANPDTTICDPGNNGGVITTAFYNSLTRGIAAESGRGFTRDNGIKPDFAAPGINIYGPIPFAGNYPLNEGERRERARFDFQSGSSQAAAIATGAVALLAEWAFIRENDISMDTVKAKKYLIRGADRTGISIPSRTWGNGTLDLYKVFDGLRLPVSD